MPEVIVVQERDDVAACSLERAVPRHRDPAVGLLDELDPRIVHHGLTNDLRGGVGRSIVDDHDLEVAERLLAQARQRAADATLALERRNDDADARAMTHTVTGRGIIRTLRRRLGALCAQLLISA